jgi:diguanylate cyclase (GGDEF)-like protein
MVKLNRVASACRRAYVRKKREGTPINYNIVKVVFGLALVMWTGAAFSGVYYTSSSTSMAISGLFVGIILSVFFGWQINAVIKKIQSDEETIEKLATHDALTGLWNRRVFHKTLKKEIEASTTSNKPLSLLMFDIDNLCDINEKYGYEPGDLILRRFAKVLSNFVRKEDLICRFRSKEIAIILPGMDLQAAQAFTQTLKTEIASHTFDANDTDKVSISVTEGVIEYSSQTPSEPAFVDACEKAMFSAVEHRLTQQKAA